MIRLLTLLILLFVTYASILAQNPGSGSDQCSNQPAFPNTFDFDFGATGVIVHSEPSTTHNCNPNGANWDVGGGPCLYTSPEIDLSIPSCIGANGVMVKILYNTAGQLIVGDYLSITIYCIDNNPSPPISTIMEYDSILGEETDQDGDELIYYVPCQSPNFVQISIKAFTHDNNKKWKIGQQPQFSCVNCFYSTMFLPITIHNERLHHQDGQLHYTFDMEDTDLEVAAIALGRSTDGSTFHPVSFTDPQPTGSQYTRYRLVDKQPELPAYYRAEVISHNGDIKYGHILYAESGQAPTPIIHPNPVQRGSNLVIEYAGSFSEGHLTDMYGRTSYSFPLSASAYDQAALPIPAHLPAGIYILRLNNQFQAATYSIVVNE